MFKLYFMKNNEKGFINIFFILGMVVIVGIAGYLVIDKYQQSPENTPTPSLGVSISPTPNLEKTSNWKIYKNEEYGFEFKYPPEFTLRIDYHDERLEGVSCKINIYFKPDDSEGKLQASACINSWRFNGSLDDLSGVYVGTSKNNWKKTIINGLNAIELVDDPNYDYNIFMLELPSKISVDIAVTDKNMNMYENIKKSFVAF